MASDLIERYRASERQVCQAMQLSRTVCRYKSVAANSSALQMRIKEMLTVLDCYTRESL